MTDRLRHHFVAKGIARLTGEGVEKDRPNPQLLSLAKVSKSIGPVSIAVSSISSISSISTKSTEAAAESTQSMSEEESPVGLGVGLGLGCGNGQCQGRQGHDHHQGQSDATSDLAMERGVR